MSDVSSVVVNKVEYDIVDSVARQSISEMTDTTYTFTEDSINHTLKIEGTDGTDKTISLGEDITSDKITTALGYVPLQESDLPTELSELSEDESHRLVTDNEKLIWNNKQDALSDEQLAAVNSGITLAKVNTYDGYSTQISNKMDGSVTHLSGDIPVSQKGTANGVATLDANGLIPSSQLPSYVDDVLEYANKSSFPAEGETGKIYVDVATNITYRWSGSAYVEISPSIALGETSSTAYAGDKGKANADAISSIQTTLNNLIWTGTQAEYDALITKDSNRIYLIQG